MQTTRDPCNLRVNLQGVLRLGVVEGEDPAVMQ
jgi:hypothetical protein